MYITTKVHEAHHDGSLVIMRLMIPQADTVVTVQACLADSQLSRLRAVVSDGLTAVITLKVKLTA